jgi:hypothetical protein
VVDLKGIALLVRDCLISAESKQYKTSHLACHFYIVSCLFYTTFHINYFVCDKFRPFLLNYLKGI